MRKVCNRSASQSYDGFRYKSSILFPPFLVVTEQIPSKPSYKINTFYSTHSFGIYLNHLNPLWDGSSAFKRNIGTNTSQCESVKYNNRIFLYSS